MKNIKNIIFDLGGVFIGIDYWKTETAFVNLGVSNFNSLYSQQTASKIFQKLETGKFSPAEFYEAFRRETKTELSNHQIENAWNAMLGSFYPRHVEWLDEIKDRYKIFLFSNTNIIHYKAFQKIYSDQIRGKNFDDYFVKAYYSHDLGLRKPNPESFQAILDKEKLKADETLFIDDTVKNIEGARMVGLHTIYLENPAELIQATEHYCTLENEV